jgi:glycosyltransferase involved in cell wall biosynthesis
MAATVPSVDLVIPVLNEAHELERSVRRVRGFLDEQFPFPATITIADNGSKDGTGDIARRLAVEIRGVCDLHLDVRGRGRALRHAWARSTADLVAYTDVDLSTDLVHLEPLCRALCDDGFDIAIGSRLMRGSQTTRGFKREFISRCYNSFVKLAVGTHFSDAQCGFKAVTRQVVKDLMPLVQDEGWFFDSELLILGEKLGYRIKDVPVKWIDDDDSRVKILPTAWEDIKGVLRVRQALREWRQNPQSSRLREKSLAASDAGAVARS